MIVGMIVIMLLMVVSFFMVLVKSRQTQKMLKKGKNS